MSARRFLSGTIPQAPLSLLRQNQSSVRGLSTSNNVVYFPTASVDDGIRFPRTNPILYFIFTFRFNCIANLVYYYALMYLSNKKRAAQIAVPFNNFYYSIRSHQHIHNLFTFLFSLMYSSKKLSLGFLAFSFYIDCTKSDMKPIITRSLPIFVILPPSSPFSPSSPLPRGRDRL